MGKVIMSGIVPPLVAPVTGIQLGDIAEGSIVKLNENGSPVEFYVAKHDYESSLNGSGRTLLVRKDAQHDVSTSKMWDAGGVNAYSGSDIDVYINGTYLDMFDTKTKSAIGTTKFYYTPMNGNTSVGTLQRAVFILSFTELGLSDYDANRNVEGSALQNVTVYQSVKYNGKSVQQWTRTPYKRNTSSVYYLNTDGSFARTDASSFASVARPCLTLPSGALFDEVTMLFNGKIA